MVTKQNQLKTVESWTKKCHVARTGKKTLQRCNETNRYLVIISLIREKKSRPPATFCWWFKKSAVAPVGRFFGHEKLADPMICESVYNMKSSLQYEIKSYTLPETNIAMEHGPGLKMYCLLKMGIFQPAMLVYQTSVHLGDILQGDNPFQKKRWADFRKKKKQMNWPTYAPTVLWNLYRHIWLHFFQW